ncbi:MAG: DsbA family protein [bacterium]|nr:DsbA family protein [bacterium]
MDQPKISGTPKVMFLLGLFVGVSVLAVIGLAGTVGFLVSGKTFGAKAGTTVAVAPTPTPSDYPDVAPPSGPLPDVDSEDHILGNVNAPVTLVEYSDFECPFCLRHLDTLNQVMADYPNDVRLVYRHFPLSFHPEAQKAAEASECASKQGKFWEMHDAIFAENAKGSMSVQRWKDVARELGLNGADFDSCLDSGETADRIASDLQEGTVAGIAGTPGTFVNGSLIEGAVPYATFKSIIDAQL